MLKIIFEFFIYLSYIPLATPYEQRPSRCSCTNDDTTLRHPVVIIYVVVVVVVVNFFGVAYLASLTVGLQLVGKCDHRATHSSTHSKLRRVFRYMQVQGCQPRGVLSHERVACEFVGEEMHPTSVSLH